MTTKKDLINNILPDPKNNEGSDNKHESEGKPISNTVPSTSLEDIANIRLGKGVWDFTDFYKKPDPPKKEEMAAYELRHIAKIFEGPVSKKANLEFLELTHSEKNGLFRVKNIEIDLKSNIYEINGISTSNTSEIGKMKYYTDKLNEKLEQRLSKKRSIQKEMIFYCPANLFLNKKRVLELPIASFFSFFPSPSDIPFYSIIIPAMEKNYAIYQVKNNNFVQGFGLIYFHKKEGVKIEELEKF